MNFKTTSLQATLAGSLAFAILGLAGCISDSHKDHDDDHHPWEHACEHAGDTPTAVAANADTAAAPLVGAAHTLYGVAFATGDKVRIEFDEHGEFGIFLSKNVPVTLTNSAGAAVAFEESVTPLEGCAGFAVMHVVDADEGAYYLTFGTTGETSVNLLVEELEHDDH